MSRDSRPQSVIKAGLADYVLPPEEMPAQFSAYFTQTFGKTVLPVSRAEDAMKKILNIMFTRTGHDFSHYKKGTVNRCIEHV